MSNVAGQATDRAILEDMLMNPCLAKTELVHYAARRVSELESELTTLRQRLEWREDGHDGIYCRDETIWLLQQDLYSRKNARGKTHCENCGCTWLDDGLNPIGCPYCKDQWQDISTAPKETRHTDMSLAIERGRAEAAEAKLEAVRGLVDNWRSWPIPGYELGQNDCADELEAVLNRK